MSTTFPKLTQLRTPEALRARLDELGVELPVPDDVDPAGPLSEPLEVAGRRIGNRFAILPMEGWDGTRDGRPSDLVRRRWRRFGASGAKLVWGGEAVAVRHDGRANPNQLVIGPRTVADLARLREDLVGAHVADHGTADDLLVGLQLTHSGRWSRPDGDPAPRTAYPHPLLDPLVGAGDGAVMTDSELDDLVGAFVTAAGLATEAGFGFVDVKHCHGYLAHELLSAVDRDGRYGGDLAGRTRFLREVAAGIRRQVPEVLLGVRLSVFDFVPHRRTDDGTGRAETLPSTPYPYAFGGDGTGVGVDLHEAHAVCDLLAELDVPLLCVTAGSPYYVPHIQRPASHPPSDGYDPPEDPLVGVARLQAAARELTVTHPGLTVVASGLSYLQEWLPHVAQGLVAEGWAHSVGLGRMALSYPTLPADALAGRPPDRRSVCRTFSDCTTAPRNGMVSGCYPLDELYKQRPERQRLQALKKAAARQDETVQKEPA